MDEFDGYRVDDEDFDDHTISLAIRILIVATMILIARLLTMDGPLPERALVDPACCAVNVAALLGGP